MAGISRRNFVKYGGAAGAAALAGCSGDGNGGNGNGNGGNGGGNGGNGDGNGDGGGSLDDGERPVQILGPAWALMDEQLEKFTEMHGIEAETTIVDQPTTVQRILGGDNEIFDAFSISVGGGAVGLVLDNEMNEPIPTEDLDKWDKENVSDLFTNPGERLSHLGEQYEIYQELIWSDPEELTELNFPPTAYNFDAIGSNPEHVEPGQERLWSDLFDEQYQGEVAMGATPGVTIPEALMHLLDNDMVEGEVGAINNPNQDQIDAAVDFLIEQKQAGQFRSTWTAYGDSVNLLASEEAVIGDLWQPAAMDVRRSGTPCEYATMSGGLQGYRFWYGGIAPVRPGVHDRNNLDEITSFVNDVHWGAWYPGFIAGSGYSVPHYPNTELLREGGDDSGEGMGPEYYDWAYEGTATYEPVDQPYLFDPLEYDWSDEEGEEHEDGQVRDSGAIDERIDRISFMQAWPDENEYMLERWSEFESA